MLPGNQLQRAGACMHGYKIKCSVSSFSVEDSKAV